MAVIVCGMSFSIVGEKRHPENFDLAIYSHACMGTVDSVLYKPFIGSIPF